MTGKLSRRQLLAGTAKVGGGLGVLAVAGFAGHELFRPPAPSPTASDRAAGQLFLTRPDLRPPGVQVRLASATADLAAGPGDPVLLLSLKHPGNGLPQFGLLITDRNGEVLWFHPMSRDRLPFDLQMQTYRGQPVLTYWDGAVVDGHGEGTAHILDASYREIAAFTGIGDSRVDLHEFTLTPEGTALMTAYRTATADLRSIGGPRDGQVYAGQVQEIDVATGRVVGTWDSLDHVPISESYNHGVRPDHPLDYFHINSISLDTDGQLLVSGRSTWTVYKVDRRTGEVIWRLGGKKSDFRLGPRANFERQHHVRMHPGNRLSIFDNAAAPVEKASRGLVLQLDTDAMTADLLQEFVHPDHLLADNQGSMQWDPDTGAALLGYGSLPRVSAFDADGRLTYDTQLGTTPLGAITSYRAMAADWHGRPRTTPDVVLTQRTGQVSVVVSWNGATDIARWRLLSGTRETRLRPVTVTEKDGFETTIPIANAGPVIAVEALDGNHRPLGRSRSVAVHV